MASPPRSRSPRASTAKAKGRPQAKGAPSSSGTKKTAKASGSKGTASKPRAPARAPSRAKRSSKAKRPSLMRRILLHPSIVGASLSAVAFIALIVSGAFLGWWSIGIHLDRIGDLEAHYDAPYGPDGGANSSNGETLPDPYGHMAFNGTVYEETPLPGVRMTDHLDMAVPEPQPRPAYSAPARAPTSETASTPAATAPQAVTTADSAPTTTPEPKPAQHAAAAAAPPPAPSYDDPPAAAAAKPQVATQTAAQAAPSEQVAMLPSAGTANWLANALPAVPANGRAMVAVVIDDMGVDVKRTAQIIALPGPLTASFLTYSRNLQDQADSARAQGHELMVHFPMEPKSTSIDPGPDVLRTTLSATEIDQRLERGLSSFTGYVGINNHMGSRFTEYGPGMERVMLALRNRGLLWLDSRTTAKSVGISLARRYGVPNADRHIFLDNDHTVASVNKQLAELERIAHKIGYAIAIGHPRDQTIAALRDWIPSLQAKGLVLVPISTIVRNHQQVGG